MDKKSAKLDKDTKKLPSSAGSFKSAGANVKETALPNGGKPAKH